MPDVLVRQAGPRDAKQIHRIEQVCFADPWALDAIQWELSENPNAFYVVAEMDDQIVGYAGLWWILDEGHITNVAVRPEYRERHIGQGILQVMIDHTVREGIRHHTLEVRVSNEPAIRLYEKMGFRVEGRRKQYYANNKEDALIMWRHENEQQGGSDA